MREFNTKEAEGNYSITFETDDRKAFEQVQTLCRILVDGKDGNAIPIEWIKKYVEDNTNVVKNPKYDGWYFSEEPIDYYIKFRPYDIEFMLNKWERENDKET